MSISRRRIFFVFFIHILSITRCTWRFFFAHSLSPFGSVVSSILFIDFLSPNLLGLCLKFVALLFSSSNCTWKNACLHARLFLGANRKCESWQRIREKGRIIVNALLNWKIRNYCAIKKIYQAILYTQWNHKLFVICVLRCVDPVSKNSNKCSKNLKIQFLWFFLDFLKFKRIF